MRPNDLLVLILQRKELELVMEKKRPAYPWHCAGAAGLKLSYSFPPPWTQFVSLGGLRSC